ncbi:MAG: hypothetical protein P8Y70_10080 [Candidatus Lokiarchaeota archaeon]
MGFILFQLKQIQQILDDAKKIESMEWIYFEGGEPFLYYPILLKGIGLAKKNGFKTGIVTNCYWATSIEDAKVWLQPFKDLNIDDFSISNDLFHFESEETNLATNVQKASKDLGISVNNICIDNPTLKSYDKQKSEKGKPIIQGGTMFRGRAADLLTEKLPKINWRELTQCPYEELKKPERVHIDPFGNVHICQGITIGNIFQTPIYKLIKNFDPYSNPIISSLLNGGPAKLVTDFNVFLRENYVDECHLCYRARKYLLERFPETLRPKQVYGL